MLRVLRRIVLAFIKFIFILIVGAVILAIIRKVANLYVQRRLLDYQLDYTCKSCVARDTKIEFTFKVNHDLPVDNIVFDFRYLENPKVVRSEGCSINAPVNRLEKIDRDSYRCIIETKNLVKPGRYEVDITFYTPKTSAKDEAKFTISLEDKGILPPAFSGKKIYQKEEVLPYPFEGFYVKDVRVEDKASVFACDANCPECLEDPVNRCTKKKVGFKEYNVAYVRYGLKVKPSLADSVGIKCTKKVGGLCEVEVSDAAVLEKIRKNTKTNGPVNVFSALLSLSFGFVQNNKNTLVLFDDWDNVYPMLIVYNTEFARSFELVDEDKPSENEVYRFAEPMTWQFLIGKDYNPAYLGAQRVSKGLLFFFIPYKKVDVLWGVDLSSE